jgi:hypothetical protein
MIKKLAKARLFGPTNAIRRVRVVFVSSQMSCGSKIIIGSNSNNDYLKFNYNFKSHMTFGRT